MRRRGFFTALGTTIGLGLIKPVDFLKSLEDKENDWFHSSRKININFSMTYDEDGELVQAYYKWQLPNGAINHIYHDITLESGLDINDPSVKKVVKRKINEKRGWVMDQYRLSIKKYEEDPDFKFMRLKDVGEEEEEEW